METTTLVGKKLNIPVRILLGIAVALFIVTFAIAVPIFCRFFYFFNVKLLDIEEKSGYTKAQIFDAYNEVMDFLVWGEEFGTGELPYSEEGKSHFEDCRKLFVLDFVVLGVSALVIVVVYVLNKFGWLDLSFKKHSPEFWALVGLGCFFVAIGAWAVIDFSGLFEVFHLIAFPGKDNWVFYPNRDAIITILPEELWFNFLLLIVGVFVAFVVAIALTEKIRKRKYQTSSGR